MEKLKLGKIPKNKIPKLINIFADEHFLEAQKEIEKFLKNNDSILRYNALSALIFEFGIKKYRKTCEYFLSNDKDELNRALGASCLGSLLKGTNDILGLRLLLNVFKNKTEKWIVRDSAYNAILKLVGVPYKKQPTAIRRLDYNKDVDWDLIRSIEERIRKNTKK